jgi:hypothetical protein
MIRRLRLFSGLAMLAYVTMHLSNHAVDAKPKARRRGSSFLTEGGIVMLDDLLVDTS